jgi:hypothetical protein
VIFLLVFELAIELEVVEQNFIVEGAGSILIVKVARISLVIEEEQINVEVELKPFELAVDRLATEQIV